MASRTQYWSLLMLKLRVRRAELHLRFDDLLPATGKMYLQLNDERGGQPESLLSDSGSDSKEMEMTDYEDEDLPFDGCAFETLLTGSQRDRVFEEAVFPYQRGPVPTLRSQQMKWKAERLSKKR